jgi:hypothetical protein
MVKQIVQVPLDDERVVFAEVDAGGLLEGDGLAPIANPEELARRAGGSVRSAMELVIAPTAGTIFARLEGMARRPDTVELEFGLSLNGKAGVVFASTEMGGHIQVKLTWNAAGSEPALSG